MTLKIKFVSGQNYIGSILKIIKKSKSKVCYVSLSRSCGSLKESFKKAKIDSKKVYIIDCITKIIAKPKKLSNCAYIQDPGDLSRIVSMAKREIRNGYKLVTNSINNFQHRIPSKISIKKEALQQTQKRFPRTRR